MKHYVVQEIRRWDIMAKSMKDAKRMVATEKNPPYEVEERTIVNQETGDEERLM